MEIFGLTILESNRDFGGKWGREKKQCYLDLKVLRIWGMLKSIRWLILISQIRIVRLILEIIREPKLHRQSEFSRLIPGPGDGDGDGCCADVQQKVICLSPKKDLRGVKGRKTNKLPIHRNRHENTQKIIPKGDNRKFL